jgi:hypothetical protein
VNIPADRIAIDGDTAWFIPQRCPETRAPQGAHWGQGNPCIYGVRALDRPCDTCDGSGTCFHGGPDVLPRCPDCDGTGRRTFTLDVEVDYHDSGWRGDCPWLLRCNKTPGFDPEGICAYGCREEPECQTCVGDVEPDGWGPDPGPEIEIATLTVHVVQVLPIVDCVGAFVDFTDYDPQPAVLFHPNVYGVRPKLLHVGGRLETIALPDATAPGMWAVRLTIHKETT